MKSITACAYALLLCLGLAACETTASSSGIQPEIARGQFERFKALAGDWRMVDDSESPGEEATISYRVTAAGSAVEEIVFPGAEHEMVTMYHLDGPVLVLTHYCALGNQPRMVAVPVEGNLVSFQFAGAGNLASIQDPHMHDAVFTFTDEDHFQTTWSLWSGGAAENVHTFVYERIAD